MRQSLKDIERYKRKRMTRKWKVTFVMFLSTSFLWLSCIPKETKEVAEGMNVKVQSVGKLMEIMHEGKINAQIALDTLKKDHLYGLGAVEGLRGELTVVNGMSYVASVDSLMAVVKSYDSAKAALFVFAYVEEWDTISLKGTENVAGMIEEAVSKSALKEPLAFQILAEPQLLQYHIINFRGEKATKSNHKQGALIGSIADKAVQIVGFFSTSSGGVYTHHGNPLHMHFLSDNSDFSGHIDSLNLMDRPIKILLPRL